VTVHGGAAPAPPPDPAPPAAAVDSEAEPVWRAEPVVAKLNITGRTMIERLQQTQPEIALRTGPSLAAETPCEEEPVAPELAPERESDIEVGEEAETLVEASFAPVISEAPKLVVGNDAARVDAIGTQLREFAWRAAMDADPSPVTPLAPALVARPVPAARRLSLHRVGMVIAALGVLGAAVYSTRLAPDNAPPPVQAAAQPAAPALAPATPPAVAVTPAPAAAPVLRPADAAPPVTGITAAAPAESAANTPEAAVAAPEGRTQEKNAAAEQPAAIVKPAVRRAPAPVVPPAESLATPAQARRVPAEPPRPCTQAIAALGLCTLESRPEEN
jgi:hypothetical protein